MAIIKQNLNSLAQIPQCTSPISHNASFSNRNGALWDTCLTNALWDLWDKFNKLTPERTNIRSLLKSAIFFPDINFANKLWPRELGSGDPRYFPQNLHVFIVKPQQFTQIHLLILSRQLLNMSYLLSSSVLLYGDVTWASGRLKSGATLLFV